MKMAYLSGLIKLFLSKADCNFKTYVHVTMLCRFFKLELGMAEVINLVDLICFITDHIFA